MPTFYARLEDPNSENFRFVTIWSAKDEAHARRILRRSELRKVIFTLSDEEVADLEAKVAAGEATKSERNALLTHGQEEAYDIVYIGTERQPRKTEKPVIAEEGDAE
jgi:hypothetical protein